jgi:hypothetical protein
LLRATVAGPADPSRGIGAARPKPGDERHRRRQSILNVGKT